MVDNILEWQWQYCRFAVSICRPELDHFDFFTEMIFLCNFVLLNFHIGLYVNIDELKNNSFNQYFIQQSPVIHSDRLKMSPNTVDCSE